MAEIVMKEHQRRINMTIANYSCKLMNNTKWREVLSLIGKHHIPVQFSFVKDETFNSLILFPEDGVEGKCVKDCSVHGPFLLSEIFAVRCPRYEEKKDSKTGKKYKDNERYSRFIVSLHSLGQLPLTEDEDGVTISAYKK